MRIFAAIPLAEDAAAALDRIAQTLPIGDPIPEDRWHITLAFAQEVTEDVAEEFALNLSELTVDRFAWRISGFATFGGDKPRQIHAVVAPDDNITAIHSKVRRAARNAGLILPHKRFVPHITLARLKGMPLDIRGADWLAEHTTRTLGPFVAEELVLFESELHHGGPRYSPIVTRYLG